MAETPPVVLVEWLDSCGLEHGGWMDQNEVDENLTTDSLLQESVGYLVADNAVAIALAGSRSSSVEDEHNATQLRDVLVIPRSALVGEPRKLSTGSRRSTMRK